MGKQGVHARERESEWKKERMRQTEQETWKNNEQEIEQNRDVQFLERIKAPRDRYFHLQYQLVQWSMATGSTLTPLYYSVGNTAQGSGDSYSVITSSMAQL